MDHVSSGLCPLCQSEHLAYLFVRHAARVHRCSNCGLTRLHPLPADTEIVSFYANSTGHDPFDHNPQLTSSFTELEAAKAYLKLLKKHHAPRSGMLLISAKGHPFITAVDREGYHVETAVDMRELEQIDLPEAHYDSAVVIFQLEKSKNPIQTLEEIRAALKPDGFLFLITPSLDSWSAQFFRSQWTEWRPENFYYFDTQTIQSALLRSGFAHIAISRDRRKYSLQHLRDRARTSPNTLLTSTVRTVGSLLPGPIRRRVRIKLPASGILVTARGVRRRERPLLSVVMPVFNERATFATTIEAVIAKNVPGIDKEIVIVESNSSDGTRDLVRSYDGRAGVTIIWEARPRGKGHAVRTGLEHATGDLILIQDADQEYDINDYDALIEPLVSYQRAFVLGSRHIGGWKIREFNDQPGITAFFNFGHVLFAGLLNLMYGQKMKDPFTMYKVFRRDCLYGLKLECNRFDFDFELVIKLVRKGYIPLEIPVNYRARSFHEGKKVSPFRDPLTWMRALAKYRFASIYTEED